MALLINFLFSSFLSFGREQALKVVIDPGHGGRDGGAAFGTLREAEIVLNVSKELARLLKDSSNFEVQLTRDSDNYKSLVTRANEANKFDADLFISIHANASRDGKAKGAEFYFQNQLAAEDEALFLAAQENQKETTDGLEPFQVFAWPSDQKKPKKDIVNIIEDLGRQDRLLSSRALAESLVTSWDHNGRPLQKALRQGPFFLLSNLKMPSVLVELGFITNYKEAKELTTQHYQKKIAQNIYNGIKTFKEYIDKHRAESLD
ncbi:MAG: N-acetylmuramoyl-L-alanine amidase [Pseudomonadota bacterium]|nr:N-acetylmuramoyl-L-alanine amidase [Pseudomonadota bacterium]